VVRHEGVDVLAEFVPDPHQVDAALAFFPRVVGLRKGIMVFDLPSSQVTSAQLTSLYESSEDSLQVDPRVDPVANVTALHCR
jgi:phosphonate transport system ATP-binding protein